MHYSHLKVLALCIVLVALLLPCCASRQVTGTQQLGRFIEKNPEQVWNSTIEVLNTRQLQIVTKNQDDPTSWIIETAMKKIKVGEMRKYALSQYGYKPNLVTYLSARYKLKIVIEPISATSCSIAVKFYPQLLAGGTSDYAGEWEDGKSIGEYEDELVQSVLAFLGSQQP